MNDDIQAAERDASALFEYVNTGYMGPSASYRTRWHIWFAWWPVRVECRWVWLRRLFRKGTVSIRKAFCVGDTRPIEQAQYDEVHWHWEYWVPKENERSV